MPRCRSPMRWSPLLFRSRFPLRGGCHGLRVRVQAERATWRTTSAATRAASPRTTRRPKSRRSRRACSREADSESRWGWLGGAFYSREKGKTAFDSYIRGYADTPSFEYFNAYETNLIGQLRSRRPIRWFLGRYDSELDQKAVFGELSLRSDRELQDHRGRALVRLQPRESPSSSSSPRASPATRCWMAQEEAARDGVVKKLNLTYKLDRDRLFYATYSEGFRVGGANQLKPASRLPRRIRFGHADNYEVGAKTEWLERPPAASTWRPIT